MPRSAPRRALTRSLLALALGCAFVSPAGALGVQLKWSYEPNISGLHLGCSLAAVGDVNGDGIGDLASSAVGGAWLFYGSTAGPFVLPHWTGTGYATTPAAIGDVNGDGFADLGLYDPSTISVAGRVDVFAGSPSGPGSTPMLTLTGPIDASNWGPLVAAGDVNGDGYDDIVLVADQHAHVGTGRIYLYAGSPAGPGSSPSWSYSFTGNRKLISALAAGDVNGDGYADIAALVRITDINQSDSTAAVLFFAGSPSGFPSSPSWVFQSQIFAYMACPGDLDGDGYSDMLATAGTGFGSVTAFIRGSAGGPVSGGNYPGGLSGWMGDVNNDGVGDFATFAEGFTCLCGNPACIPCGVFPDIARFFLSGSPAITGYGFGAPAGDVGGDGRGTVMTGSCNYSNGQTDEGQISIWAWDSAVVDTIPRAHDGSGAGAEFGTAVAAIGDLNGDGFGDFAVGAPGYGDEFPRMGRVSVFLGPRTDIAAVAAFGVNGSRSNAALGSALAGVGDVNGDGYADLLMGAPHYSNGETDEGEVQLLLGGAVPDSTPDWSIESNQANAKLGAAVAWAGDVNGDGYSDVLVAAPGGSLVGPASVGSGRPPAATIEGSDAHAMLYLGSNTGLGVSPAWTVSGDSFSGFATAVAGIGDVNRDGYSDIAVGVPGLDQVLVYLGSPSGPSTTPAFTLTGAGAFGTSIAAAGDVNGDGYADVIVGSPRLGFEAQPGRAEVFLGSNSGPVTPAAWTADGVFSDQLGAAVTGAGDFDDDGYSDVAVGLPGHSSGSGEVLVYAGSATGLSTLPVATIPDAVSGENLGASLATGDIDGNGYSDLMIGVPNHLVAEYGEGRVDISLGYCTTGKALIPRQARADGSPPIALLGAAGVNAFRNRLRGSNGSGRCRVRLEWQVHALGGAWGPIQRGPWIDTGAPQGPLGSRVDLSGLVPGLAAATPYAWRARVAARTPLPFQRSRWVSMPGNGAHETDIRTGAAVLAVSPGHAARLGRLIQSAQPNPTSSAVRVMLALPADQAAVLEVLDVSGRRIRRITSSAGTAATRELTWDARNDAGVRVKAGLYIFRVTTAGRSEMLRLVVLR